MTLWIVSWHWNDDRGNKVWRHYLWDNFITCFFRVSKSNQILAGINTKNKVHVSESVSHLKLFMNIMKMKNGNQNKIQKSQNGGGNNANKNFMSWAEQGYIPNTISYLELFMNTIKIKDFCNRYQYEMQKSWDGEGNNAYKIFMSRVEEGYIPNTISYVEQKIISAMDISMKCRKA